MKKIFLALASCILVQSFSAQQNPSGKNLSIWFDRPNSLKGEAIWNRAGGTGENPDPEWENASLPLGNGFLGANVMGSVNKERITLNEKSLWKGGPNTSKGPGYYWNVNKNSAAVLKEIRAAFLAGDSEKATRLTQENFNGVASYTDDEKPFRFGSFTTMGELVIATGIEETDIQQYRRRLSLDSAVAEVSFLKNGVHYRRNSFVSYPDRLMVLRFAADNARLQNLCLEYHGNPEADGQIVPDGKNGILYSGQLRNNKMKFALRIRAFSNGGEIRVENGKIYAMGADEVMFLISAATDYKMNFDPDFQDPETYVGQDPLKSTRRWLQKAERKSYGQLLNAHLKDYQPLFNRVNLEINSSGDSELPTPKRLSAYRGGNEDFGLETLYFQFGRYLLLASSREGSMPANLQGIWLNNTDGPWRSDYHNNINIQMNYWPALSANLKETMPPLVDYIRSLQKPGAETAKAYFNARGWTASISSNIFGFTAPLRDKDMTWNFNPMAGPWLSTHLWEYYDYTRDKIFLEKIAFPLLKSSADFTVDYLWKNPEGFYTAAPSTSPEHGPVDQGATFANAVAREILMDAIAASRILNAETKQRTIWEKVLQKMLPYKIGRYGQLQEWYEDIDDPQDQHRHVNHLFGLMPGHSISPVETPELAKAARVVLEQRGDGATGWSMGWKLNLWARLLDGDHAYLLFQNLLKTGTLDNLWDTHPPFQIDGNFGGSSGNIEMLLQSQMGYLHLLPALPHKWQQGSVKGLMAKGNFEVSLKWNAHQLEGVEIVSHAGELCKIRYRDQEIEFPTRKGVSYQLIWKEGKLLPK